MIEIGIIGANGYTGGELLRLLDSHPQAEVTVATSRKLSGKPIYKVHPHLRNLDLKFEKVDPADMEADLVFTATPHGASMNIVPTLVENGIRVVDLSGDYRFDDLNVYEKWYGLKHTHPLDAVYGLPEIYREQIKKADLVANPGCFPTGAILTSLPLVKEKLVSRIIVDSKTGVSGAGVKPSETTMFTNVSDNVIPYLVTSHRHGPEIQEKLAKYTDVGVSFTPHLVPVIRGILSTIHTFPEKDVNSSYIKELYDECYEGEPFVNVLNVGEIPRLSSVRGSNFCHIGSFDQDENGRLVVVSSIDNMVKGASGQAIHNMNIMFGFKETQSLEYLGLHP
ncbi:MAG TPA: N-acetyl-gamma-glutamyl-phosphate reductase [Methanobacterium sp.]|nr:N-acetyl-gamma-glutamyl-phosphate reductase [Methanobacterium sp.]